MPYSYLVKYQFCRTNCNMNRIMNFIVIVFLVTLFTSCLGPNKINKWVNQQYGGTINNTVKKKEDIINVNSTVTYSGGGLSQTEKKTSKLLPLIFYWQYDYVNTCTLNPQIPVNDFTSVAMNYTRNNILKQKLNGNRLELTLEKIPGSFVIDDKGHIVWVIYAFSWDNVSIKNLDKEMTVSYRVLNGNNAVKTGSVIVTAADKEVPLGMFQSLKRKTKEFLTAYDVSVKNLAKTAMEKIISEL